MYTVRVLPRVADLIFSVVHAAVGVCANSGAVAQSAATNRSVFMNVNNRTKESTRADSLKRLLGATGGRVHREPQRLEVAAKQSTQRSVPTSWNQSRDLFPESGDLVGGKINQAGQKKEPMEAGWGRIKEAFECLRVDGRSQSRPLAFCQALDVGRGHGHWKARQWAANESRLSYGALKKDSFHNLRAPAASRAC